MVKVPIIYAYIHFKIKNKYPGISIVGASDLKSIIGMVATRVGFVPHFLYKEVIDELVEWELFERINNFSYKLLKNPLENRIKKIVECHC